jgi:polyisoprenoid-binding protein YceI
MMSRSIHVCAFALLLSAATLFATEPGTNGVPYRVEKAEVVIVCPLTVGGSFEAKTSALSGEVTPRPGDAGVGSLQVNLETLETGIGLRDRHMLENYLEVQKGPEYATAVLEDIRIERLNGKTTMKGMLRLHGQRREVTGEAEIRQDNDGVRVQAQFPVRVSEFQIPKPSYLGVGVRDEILVKVSMTAAPSATNGRQ